MSSRDELLDDEHDHGDREEAEGRIGRREGSSDDDGIQAHERRL